MDCIYDTRFFGVYGSMYTHEKYMACISIGCRPGILLLLYCGSLLPPFLSLTVGARLAFLDLEQISVLHPSDVATLADQLVRISLRIHLFNQSQVIQLLLELLFASRFKRLEVACVKSVGPQHESFPHADEVEPDRTIFFGDVDLLALIVDGLADVLFRYMFFD